MSRTHAETSEAEPFPVLDPLELSRIGARNLDALSRAARAFADGAAEINRVSATFAMDRLAGHVEAASRIMTARTAEEAFHHQAVYVESSLRDYADHAGGVLTRAADMMREAYHPVEARAEEVLHDFEEMADAAAAASPGARRAS